MPENIIITPGSGKIDFSDSADTLTTLVIESGALKFKRGATEYLALDNTNNSFRVNTADLYVNTSVINNAGTLIVSSGWTGTRQPTGPAGAQGNAGAAGGQGAQGAQGAQGGQGAQGVSGTT